MLTRRGPFGRSAPVLEHALLLLIRLDEAKRELTPGQYDIVLEVVAARLARDFIRDQLDGERAA